MPRIDIHTTLGFCPKPKKHEILVITRGATASINFDLFDKVYKLEDIDQFTYLFKQGKDLWAYQMIEYYKLTEDTTVKTDKYYYERIDANIGEVSSYKFIKKDDLVVGAQIPADTYYEEYELSDGEITDNWQLNKHFSYSGGKNYSYINFILFAEDTKQFKITEPDCNVECEVAIKLNTDMIDGLHNLDSVVITPQHPIAVVDSLYSKISQAANGGTGQSAIVSENTYCSDTLVCSD